jgi:DNA-binding transcriptional MerR regulator
MPKIDNDMPLIALNQVAEILNAKTRTLRAYEEKGLLPKRNEKKLYSINDLNKIELVHYLASVKKINANGIRFIQTLMDSYLKSEDIDKILQEAESIVEDFKDQEETIPESF